MPGWLSLHLLAVFANLWSLKVNALHLHGLAASSLGVHRVQLFARTPVEGSTHAHVVLLHIWLKHVTPPDAGGEPRFMLPGQVPAVHALIWVEVLERLNHTAWAGVARMAIDPDAWQPKLTLVLADGREVVGEGVYATSPQVLFNQVQPLDVTFTLPPAEPVPAGGGAPGGEHGQRCFKVWEASFPDNRAPFCLPPSSAALCHRLAPPAAYTPDRPALWSVLIPFRSMGTPWGTHVSRTTARLHHHLAYLREVGAAGALLYTDPLMRQALEAEAAVQRFLREGRLMFVTWDMMERRDYMWDHHMVYGHAALGLAGCGTNLWLQLSDLDEMLFSVYDSTWPHVYSCLVESAVNRTAVRSSSSSRDGAPAPAVFRLYRVDVLSSRVAPEDEAALWYTAPATAPAAATAAGRPPPHPLDSYDRISKTPLWTGKMLACPAARVVDSWAHDARALLGSWHVANSSCAFILHVKNYWRPRAYDNASEFEPFRFLALRTKAAAGAARSGQGTEPRSTVD